jgi:hypothetical protein
LAERPSRARCTATTKAGNPCRAWAIRGSDPPLCATHSGRTEGAGAPPRNTNAQKHGFYSTTIPPDDLADLIALADNITLDDEIALCRSATRQLAEHLHFPDLPPEDYAKLATLLFAGARTIAKLLRDKRALSGDSADGIAGAIGQALDELATEWGLPL